MAGTLINGSIELNRSNQFELYKAELSIPFIYDEAYNFNEGLAAVRTNDKWGFIDPAGQMVIAPSYDEVYDFSESRAVVRQDKKYFVIDKYGNEL